MESNLFQQNKYITACIGWKATDFMNCLIFNRDSCRNKNTARAVRRTCSTTSQIRHDLKNSMGCFGLEVEIVTLVEATMGLHCGAEGGSQVVPSLRAAVNIFPLLPQFHCKVQWTGGWPPAHLCTDLTRWLSVSYSTWKMRAILQHFLSCYWTSCHIHNSKMHSVSWQFSTQHWLKGWQSACLGF